MLYLSSLLLWIIRGRLFNIVISDIFPDRCLDWLVIILLTSVLLVVVLKKLC